MTVLWLWKQGGVRQHPSLTYDRGKMWISYGTAAQTEVTEEMMLAWGYERAEGPWQWLASTLTLQRDAFGEENPKEGDDLADYVVMNATALTAEMSEMLHEVGWKAWTSPRGWVNREAYISELVDVGHFLANLLVAVGCTDAEWEKHYRAKQALNLKRQRDGYDGVTGKCRGCGRALDDPHVACFVKPDGVTVCAALPGRA